MGFCQWPKCLSAKTPWAKTATDGDDGDGADDDEDANGDGGDGADDDDDDDTNGRNAFERKFDSDSAVIRQ